MKYEEARKKLKQLKEDVDFKKHRLELAKMELEVWEDFIQRMINKGRK